MTVKEGLERKPKRSGTASWSSVGAPYLCKAGAQVGAPIQKKIVFAYQVFKSCNEVVWLRLVRLKIGLICCML